MKNNNCLQQLGFRWAWKANNETRVGRNRLHAVNTYGVIDKLFEWITRGLSVLFFCGVKSRWFLVFSFTFGHKFPYPLNYFSQGFRFWLPPRYQAGGPRWSKSNIRCKLPVLQHGHLGINIFFSAFSNIFTLSFSCKSFSFCRFHVELKKP